MLSAWGSDGVTAQAIRGQMLVDRWGARWYEAGSRVAVWLAVHLRAVPFLSGPSYHVGPHETLLIAPAPSCQCDWVPSDPIDRSLAGGKIRNMRGAPTPRPERPEA